jgi:acyl-CoA thioesterase-1
MLWCNSWASDPVLLVLGDSLSAGYGIKTEQGWVSLLQKKLQDNGYAYHVVNASISGETTEGGLARLPALLEQHHPLLLVIELGANDGLRGFTINIFQEHLDALVDLGTQYHARVLLVGVQLPLNYGPRYTQLFDQGFVEVSARHHIARAPSLLGEVPLHDELMQKDGLHPNAIAQPQLLDHVWPYLQPLLQLPLQPRLQQPPQKQAAPAHEH